MIIQSYFREYNRKYFGGKLPRYTVRFKKNFPTGQSGETDERRKIISIDWKLRNYIDIVRQTLLHEMVHAKLHLTGYYDWKSDIEYTLNLLAKNKLTAKYHDAGFEREMLRLAKKRAFKGLW